MASRTEAKGGDVSVMEGSSLEILALTILEAKRSREAAEQKLSGTPSWRFRKRVRRERHVELRAGQEQQLLALRRSLSDNRSRRRLASLNRGRPSTSVAEPAALSS